MATFADYVPPCGYFSRVTAVWPEENASLGFLDTRKLQRSFRIIERGVPLLAAITPALGPQNSSMGRVLAPLAAPWHGHLSSVCRWHSERRHPGSSPPNQ
ncbi:MAG: hypothetical protein HOM62_21175 [Rhodospirillaceae bacterium]|nr:hypothetical protein [Rhodospirillaceae bacterium]MBT5083089.1 hypothetical protein [Rhodospirillaceae bacterium]MBT6589429.1 hypothetical protein [Rhodospirillaceae bacterium]